MKIIILGSGQVGSSVAENLVSEANDITIVDTDEVKLKQLQNRFDLRVVVGNASHPSVLANAGAEDADLLIAVTHSDEINMLACKIAHSLFNIPTRIARIRAPDFLQHSELFTTDNFAVDYSICPEQIVTEYITKLIEFPEALQVLSFAQGKISLAAVRAHQGSPLVGSVLQNIRQHIPDIDTRVAAIFRQNRPIMPKGDTIIEAGDEVFFIAATAQLRTVMREIRHLDKAAKKIMIAGGGNIGRRLAKSLENNYQVKIIDHNRQNCERLANFLESALVLQGEVTDEELLDQENIEEIDVFCALTNDDEDNIMASLLAKRMGAKKVIALINRGAYVDIVQSGQIDIAISPAQTTIGSVLQWVRRGDMAAVHALRRGAAEALEIVAHGDSRSSRVIGRRIDEIDLPKGATIAALLRGQQVLIAHHDLVIQNEDHVIIFVVNKRILPKVEKLFQVGIGFF